MIKNFELLAPGGDIDSIKAAILSGADAIYCGLDHFNARQRATNITFDDLSRILKHAHNHHCKVYLTLNIIILENEIPTLIRLLNKIINIKLDGLIVQDLGLFYLLSNYFDDIEVHASTQTTTHNEGQISFLKKLGVTRVNLSRELNIKEIKTLTSAGHKMDIETEVFVHGSYCIGFSGICYFSSVFGGSSGNRGRCSQPCRDQYLNTPVGKDYPLNLKDNSVFFDLEALSDAGVDALKIEGRIKKSHYVYTVVNCWKKHIQSYSHQKQNTQSNSDLYKVFNRDFSNGYLSGDIHKNMFIDNPRDNSLKHLSEIDGNLTVNKSREIKQVIYDEKAEIINTVQDKIKDLKFTKSALRITITGTLNTPIKVLVEGMPDTSFEVFSESNLIKADKNAISGPAIKKRFKQLNNSEYHIEHLYFKGLQSNLFIPFNELSILKNNILLLLNGSKKRFAPIEVPVFKKPEKQSKKPNLSILISSEKDIAPCLKTSADVYFQLPDCLGENFDNLADLFLKNEHLIPWFPSIIIGNDYTMALKFLEQLKPKLIVSNNTGIAYEANQKGIDWVAGPALNITNSFSLLVLKSKFNCRGAFISNEVSKNQIKQIVRPDNFDLYYSIYHPILLLTSRQCLFHQSVGCEKEKLDEACLQACQKSTTITNLKNISFLIDKQKGNYNSIYSNTNFLNTEILNDLPDTFSDFFLDLRDIKTGTKIEKNKTGIIHLFENFLNRIPGAKLKLNQNIYTTTSAQYEKGI